MSGILTCRFVEGSRPAYHHDWYTDCPSVVHLRLRESGVQTSPTPTPRDAWEPQTQTGTKETGCLDVILYLKHDVLYCINIMASILWGKNIGHDICLLHPLNFELAKYVVCSTEISIAVMYENKKSIFIFFL